MARKVLAPSAAATSVADMASRLRVALAAETVAEVRMFGGVAFLRGGHMLVVASRRGGILVRVGKDGYPDALAQPGATPMRMSGREMQGFVYLDARVLDDVALEEWIERALAFNRTLPAKEGKAKRQRAAGSV